MVFPVDARIPVTFGTLADVGPSDATLTEGVDFPLVTEAPAHAPACSCCGGRSPAAAALGRLFLETARGDRPAFARVVAVTSSDAGRRAIADALAGDVVASVRFRLTG